MLSIRKILLLAGILTVAINLHAQFVDYGTDPFRYKWNIVRTDHYKVIYPQGNDSMAYRYARLLETAYPHVERTIGKSRKTTFPVILHPGNMRSNGMVAWAPRRMELITTPSSDLYAQSWDRQLVLHESRHIFQTNKTLRGIFTPLYFLLGEQVSGISAFGLAGWFLEGDAVATETALSNSGRGRLPEFNMIYRAQLISGEKFYNFDKWFLGSYKHYTGTKYALGYNMSAYARYRFGTDLWNKVTTRYVDRILMIPPFANAMKHHVGIGPGTLFKDTHSFLEKEWQAQDSIYQATALPIDYLTPETKEYTTYKYPQITADSSVISVKTCLSDINSLVMVKGGVEKRLTYLGSLSSRIILKNNRVYWTEYVPGLRWSHENYSVLKYYDLTNGKVKTITPRERYLAPAVAPSGKTVAVSEFTETGINQLILLNADTGKKIKSYDIPSNGFAKEITYGEENQVIIISIADNGINLLELNTETGNWKPLLAPTFVNITSPTWQNGKLIFESGLNGTNNIYYLDTRTAQPYQLTTSRFGAFTPTLSEDGKNLLFSDYYTRGYRLASQHLDSLTANPVDFTQPYRFTLAETLKEQEQFNLDTAQLKEIEFKPKRYYRALNLIKVHSWTPFYYDVSDLINLDFDDFSSVIKPGATLISQNSLNTAIAQAGWYYSKGYHHGKLSFTYAGWYPVIDLDVDYGGKAIDILWNEDKSSLVGRKTGRNQAEVEAHIYVPFNLTSNHYTRGIQPAITYYYTNDRYQQQHSGKLRNFQYILPEVRIYNYRRMSHRDILPKWGYQLRLQHLSTLFNSENYGKLYAARLTTYSPGIFANNGVMLRFGYQYQSVDDKALYVPKQLLNEPRGYNYAVATRQQVELKADYSFSIFCPDLSIGPIAYIQRLRSNIFYDATFNQTHKGMSWKTYNSYGIDFIIDWKAIQSDFPIATGIRVIKPVLYDKLKTDLLFSITF